MKNAKKPNEKDKKSAANKMVKLFYKTFTLLTKNPDLGKLRTDLTLLDVKFYVVKKKYLVVYKIIENKLRILRVLSTYQDVCHEIK